MKALPTYRIVGADIAYIFLYINYNAGHTPFFLLVYPESIAVGTTLLASSAVSLSRSLGKFNFGTLAYSLRDTSYHLASANHGARHRPGSLMPTRGAGAGKGAGWMEVTTPTMQSNVSTGARKDSGSKAEILQGDGIYRKVEVSQEIGRQGTPSASGTESR